MKHTVRSVFILKNPVNMKKRDILVLCFALLLGCNTTEERNNSNSDKPITVKVTVVKKGKVASHLRYSGTIEASQTIPLNFKTTGTVEKVLVYAGDIVVTGQLLATLDPADARNMYDIALSQYNQAKDAYDRLKHVHENGSLPEIKWVEMDSKLTQATSSLDLAKNNLEKCNLHSPVNGIVGRRNIEPGMSSISISSAPIELVDIRKVYVKISVPENEVSRIKKGMRACFTVSALNEMEFCGDVFNVSPVADKISRTYEAKILVSNPGEKLKPGMVCDVRMEDTTEEEVILVPNQSMTRDHIKGVYVFIVDPVEKRARKHTITPGPFHETGIEVISGLEAGQLIVEEGKEKLYDNCLIVF